MSNVVLHPLPLISLCTGAGMLDRGFSLAMRICGFDARTVCCCERDAYAAALLVDRMEEQRMDPAPVWSDLNTFPARRFNGKVAAVIAGIPCQGHSVAGKRKIAQDHRNLWPQTRQILRYSRASLFALENVGGLLIPNRKEGLEAGIRRVIHELAEDGWVGCWGVLRASDVGANHRRERVFLLAHRGLQHLQLQKRPQRTREPQRGDGELADADQQRLQGRKLVPTGRSERPAGPGSSGIPLFAPARNDYAEWLRVLRIDPSLMPAVRRRDRGAVSGGPQEPEPEIRGVADGLAFGSHTDRADRLRVCGNGVVYIQAAVAYRQLWMRLMERMP